MPDFNVNPDRSTRSGFFVAHALFTFVTASPRNGGISQKALNGRIPANECRDKQVDARFILNGPSDIPVLTGVSILMTGCKHFI